MVCLLFNIPMSKIKNKNKIKDIKALLEIPFIQLILLTQVKYSVRRKSNYINVFPATLVQRYQIMILCNFLANFSQRSVHPT